LLYLQQLISTFGDMKATITLKVLLLTILLGWNCRCNALITVDSVASTPSNCANDGTITVFAQSPSTMLFAIVNGPDIRPPQNGSQFGALPSGAYQLMVTNFSNDTALVNVVVGGTYQFPDFAPTFQDPLCAGTATGSINGFANVGTGRAPYTWVLTNIGTGAVLTQTSDSFANLVAGNYRLRMYDSCQAFATRFVTLTDPTDTFLIGLTQNQMIGCNTTIVQTWFYSLSSKYTPPFYVTITANGITYTKTHYSVSPAAYPYAFIQDTFAGITYGDTAIVTIVDGCGQSSSHVDILSDWDFSLYFPLSNNNCVLGNYVTFYYISNASLTIYYEPTQIVIRDSTASNALIDSVSIQGVLAYTSPLLTPGHLYVATLRDNCGHLVRKYFTPPALNTPWVDVRLQPYSCLDSTASLLISGYNFSSLPVPTILSGPATVQSTKPYFTHQDSIIYPQSQMVFTNNCSGYSPPGICYQIGGLGIGTYQWQMQDTCGHVITGNFTIGPQDVADFTYRKQIIRGCPGQNKINYDFYRQDGFFPGYTKLKHLGANAYLDSSNAYILTIDSSVSGTYRYIYSANYTFSNLNAGSYVLVNLPQDNNYSYPYTSKLISPTMNCSEFYDTIVIPPYQPPMVAYATQIKCNGTVNVGLQPDSSQGVPPYNYEIISGPQTSSVQASPFFTLMQQGGYVARISDTCGFARTFSFYVDTLSFQQIVKVGSSCLGNTATLVCQYSPYATYIWQKPNGTFFTGDSLYISPITAIDYGVYQIKKIVSVNNCSDTFYTNYTLVSSAVTDLYDTICAGNSITFGAKTYTTSGIYSDTFSTISCDSIRTLHLTVNPLKHDSFSQSICIGQRYTVGLKNYTTTGIYRDTFSTSTCDSIRILDLVVSTQKQDSIILSICAGQSISVGTKTYNTSGIYRDTFPTIGCDSIRILNLTVTNIKRDSIVQIICAGQSITIGTKTYNSTGIYSDTFSTASCDSIRVLLLEVAAPTFDTVSQSICAHQSISIGPKAYTSSGTYIDTFSTIYCDSIRVLNLVVEKEKSDTISLHFCEGEQITIDNKTYSQPGYYTDTFSTALCDSFRTHHITVYPNPIAHITANSTNLVQGDTIQLNTNAEATYSYLWTSNAYLSNTTIVNPFASIASSSWITVLVTDTNNCRAYDSIYITIQDCESSIYIPNAFTPNGDGNNDGYRIFGNCIQLNQLLIFNRWGEKVWETKDMEKEWNGNFKGVLQPSGVYVYWLSYNTMTTQNNVGKEVKGSITLIR
jgi:gliding motility-associated-like protein